MSLSFVWKFRFLCLLCHTHKIQFSINLVKLDQHINLAIRNVSFELENRVHEKLGRIFYGRNFIFTSIRNIDNKTGMKKKQICFCIWFRCCVLFFLYSFVCMYWIVIEMSKYMQFTNIYNSSIIWLCDYLLKYVQKSFASNGCSNSMTELWQSALH